MAYWVVKVGSGNWVYKESGLPSKTTKKFEEHESVNHIFFFKVLKIDM